MDVSLRSRLLWKLGSTIEIVPQTFSLSAFKLRMKWKRTAMRGDNHVINMCIIRISIKCTSWTYITLAPETLEAAGRFIGGGWAGGGWGASRKDGSFFAEEGKGNADEEGIALGSSIGAELGFSSRRTFFYQRFCKNIKYFVITRDSEMHLLHKFIFEDVKK